MSFILRTPNDPHLRRWMLFIDGENLTIRGQEFAKQRGITLEPGTHFCPNIYLWMPGVVATQALTNTNTTPVPVQPHAIRAFYYTSITGDDLAITRNRESLWSLGFQPEVFKKAKLQDKAKGIDVALTKDMLSNAFRNNFDVAVLIAGDGDYVPLVEELKRLGKVIYVMFFRQNGLSAALRLSSDMYFELDEFYAQQWAPLPDCPKEGG